MSADSLLGHVRRGVVAIVGVLVLLAGPLAPPAQAQDYEGSFTAAYADPASVSLDQWAGVHFTVSAPMQSTGAYVVVRDAQGASVVTCNAGIECVYWFNPLPGVTHTFTADLLAPRNGSAVVVATAGPVSVTDTGWAGDFTHALAENPTPVLDVSTLVKFGLSAPLSAAILDVRDEKGALVASCSQGNECDVHVNPGPGETKTYTASLRVLLAGQWVERASRSVTVKDPGWQGTIAAASTNKTFVKPGSTAWMTFVTQSPRSMASVEVYVDGVYRTLCGAPGGELTCTIDMPMGVDEIRTVTANVMPYLVEGWATPRASTTQIVTSMTEEGFSTFLETAPAAVLEAELGASVARTVTLIRAQTLTSEFCVTLGAVIVPRVKYWSSASDFTLDCTAGVYTMAMIMTMTIGTLGVEAGINLVGDAVAPHDQQPELDPIQWPGGGGASGGGGSGGDPADICRVTAPDGEELVLKHNEFNRHIVEFHTGEVADNKSGWGTGEPGADTDLDELADLICEALGRNPMHVDESVRKDGSINRNLRYANNGENVGRVRVDEGGELTSRFTVTVRPDGTVSSAYPGW